MENAAGRERERKRLEAEVAGEKREGVGGGGLTVRSETLCISATIAGASGPYCVVSA